MKRSTAIFAILITVVSAVAGLGSLYQRRKFKPLDWREWVSFQAQNYSVVIEGRPVLVVPSQCELRGTVSTPLAGRVFSESFGGGWRIEVMSGAVSPRTEAGPGLVELHSQPYINGRWIMTQYYRVLGERLLLVRLEDDKGRAVRNNYGAPNHTIGPQVPIREAQAWEASLSSPDPAEILWALAWLGGTHADPVPPPPNYLRESLEDARRFQEVLKREGVQSRLRVLSTSPNPWIAEAAKQALIPAKE